MIIYQRNIFSRFAKWISRNTGHPVSFVIACLVILVWMLSGPLFHFSDTWQLAINTGTTIVTFLMVFLIQNTQNRDSEAAQLKLDELIRSIEGAHNALLDLEELTEKELDQIKSHYVKLARKSRKDLLQGYQDTGRPELSGESDVGNPT